MSSINYRYLLSHGLTHDQWYLLALLNQDIHIVILLVIIKVYCIQFLLMSVYIL